MHNPKISAFRICSRHFWQSVKASYAAHVLA